MIRSHFISSIATVAALGLATPVLAQTSATPSAQGKPLCSTLNHPNAGKLADKSTGMAKENSQSAVHVDCIPDSEASASSAGSTSGSSTSGTGSTSSTAPSAFGTAASPSVSGSASSSTSSATGSSTDVNSSVTGSTSTMNPAIDLRGRSSVTIDNTTSTGGQSSTNNTPTTTGDQSLSGSTSSTTNSSTNATQKPKK